MKRPILSPRHEPGGGRNLEDGLGSVGQPVSLTTFSARVPTRGLFGSKGSMISRACLALQDSSTLRMSDSFSGNRYVPDTGTIKAENSSVCFQGPPIMRWGETGE